MEKPTIPKGTRDFGPAQMTKRQFIIENIKKVFQKYGFQPLETPAMENLTTLTGKYGEEGDQLLFKVLNSGDYQIKLKDYLNFNHNNQKITFNFFEELALKLSIEFSGHKNLEELAEQIRNSLIQLMESLNIESDLKILIENYIINEIGYVSLIINNWLFQYRKGSVMEPTEIQQIVNDISKHYAFYEINSIKPKELTQVISEKGLRYDLTVPLARYVVMNRGEITFPFKRYQIQPVWRADRPQKGRYREFYQCDADVIGTDSLICEAEIILMIKEVFSALGIGDFSIKINHRAILSGLAELCDAKENESSLFVAIDKLDKIGEGKVKEELRGRGFSESSLIALFEILNFKGNTQQKIEFLSVKFSNSPSGQKGIADFKEVLSLIANYGATEEHVEFDISLARGLSYYTGCIFEVKINNVSIGSVSGGGRYDNLTGGFGLPGVSGVGFSFGVDRLYDAMEELKLFPQEAQVSTQVMIVHFDAESKHYGLKVLQQLREKNIASEIYPDAVKIQKQLDYANKKMIPFVIVIGSEEMKSGLLAFKDMRKGEQEKISVQDILKKLTTL